LDGLKKRLTDAFKLKPDSVDCVFLGREAIVCRIVGIPKAQVLHPVSDIFDAAYKPCPADQTVKACVTGLTPTLVVHCHAVELTINHTKLQGLSEDRFKARLKPLEQKFGFVVSSFTDYTQPGDRPPNVLGQAVIEVSDPLFAISLAAEIRNEIEPNASFDPDQLLSDTQTIMATNRGRRIEQAADKPPPMRVKPTCVQRLVPQSAIENLKAALARSGKTWQLDENYRILAVPGDETDELAELIARLNRKEDDVEFICQYLCGDEAVDVLPAQLCFFEKNGSVHPFGICRPCMALQLQEALGAFFNPNTQMLDFAKLRDLGQKIEAFPLMYDEEDAATKLYWPNVPLGSTIWSLMSDKRQVAPFVRAWVTAAADFATRHAPQLITCCPNHRAIPLRVPAPGANMKCAHCQHMLCGTCSEWHAMTEPCRKEVPGTKRCPGCRIPVVKVSGCNRITCRCGISFCYACDKPDVYATAQQVYDHMTAVKHW
jgi:hypothetical protein